MESAELALRRKNSSSEDMAQEVGQLRHVEHATAYVVLKVYPELKPDRDAWV